MAATEGDSESCRNELLAPVRCRQRGPDGASELGEMDFMARGLKEQLAVEVVFLIGEHPRS